MTEVTANTTYTDVENLPSIVAGTRVVFAYHAIDTKTPLGKQLYHCRVYHEVDGAREA